MKNVSVKVVERVETHVWCSITLFWISCHLWDIVEKYCRVGQATDDNMAHARCWIPRVTNTHSGCV